MSLIENLPIDAGILICGHGSRATIAEKEFSLLAKGLRFRFPSVKVEYGFLEYSAPNIHMALDKLREQGVKKIYAIPGMLFAATHAKNDIPSVLISYQQKHPDIVIEYGQELGLQARMISAFQTRILESLGLGEIPKTGDLYDTMLVVVGRGTSVVEANAEATKLTRIVCENLGFGWSDTVYSGVTFPSVGRGLEMAVKLGFEKIVVAPYFLFGGKLIDRIYAYIDKVSEKNSDITFVKTDYLRDQPQVIDAFIARIKETIDNRSSEQAPLNLMQDFKYRLNRGDVSIHHHHAEFKQEATDSHHSGHSHSHSHGHSHAPYKHIAHPHGPRTMINEAVCCCFMGQFPQQVIDEEIHIRAKAPGTPSCKKN